MKSITLRPILCLLVIALIGPAVQGAPASQDPEAHAIAEGVMEAMGGREAWNNTRHVSWRFFGGGRRHYWDKWNGDIRIETPAGTNRAGEPTPARLVLMNLNTRVGRAWTDGVEITDPAELAERMDGGWRAWVNDAYWAFMPYKMLDPGVNLRYMGEDLLEDDRAADVIQMTFEEVGVTPDNRYLVYVARDSGLVEQWSYFPTRDAAEPGFTRVWHGWQRFGDILLATDRGDNFDWELAVYDELPEALYTDPAFVLE